MIRPTPTLGPAVYLGTVTRVDGDRCYVEVPALARGFEYGPARYPADGIPPAAADTVAVAFLNGVLDELVVLARMA